MESLLAQTYDHDRFEIIIVDNQSTDDTAKVIAELARKSEVVRGMTESRRGAHFARNSGAQSSKGEILYFTDDDMIADPAMLRQLVAPFASGANVGSATGRVIPQWQSVPPPWVIEHCHNQLLSLIDRGESTFTATDDPGVFSCHQAVSREAFMKAGGFNPDTNAGKFVGDNETGLNIKIKRLGYEFAYVGAAVTAHVIPAARMTQRYLNGRFADQGLCDSYTAYRRKVPGKFGLAGRMAFHAAMVLPTTAEVALRFATGRSSWRLSLARMFYLRNRFIYDSRLLRFRTWRQFALRDNWLTDG